MPNVMIKSCSGSTHLIHHYQLKERQMFLAMTSNQPRAVVRPNVLHEVFDRIKHPWAIQACHSMWHMLKKSLFGKDFAHQTLNSFVRHFP